MLRRHRAPGILRAASCGLPLLVVLAVTVGCGRVGSTHADPGAITPDNAEAGQCVDLPKEDSTGVGDIEISEKDCDEPHDAEIVLVSTAGAYDGDLAKIVDASAVCTSLMDREDIQEVIDFPGELVFNVLIRDPEDIQPDDTFLCYVVSELGLLNSPIL